MKHSVFRSLNGRLMGTGDVLDEAKDFYGLGWRCYPDGEWLFHQELGTEAAYEYLGSFSDKELSLDSLLAVEKEFSLWVSSLHDGVPPIPMLETND